MKYGINKDRYNKDSKTSISINGPTFSCLFVLTLFLSFLKIGGYLDWNWIWILSPMWLCIFIPISLYLLLLSLWLGANILIIVIDAIIDHRRKKKLNRF